jgi:hypothetical protein
MAAGCVRRDKALNCRLSEMRFNPATGSHFGGGVASPDAAPFLFQIFHDAPRAAFPDTDRPSVAKRRRASGRDISLPLRAIQASISSTSGGCALTISARPNLSERRRG